MRRLSRLNVASTLFFSSFYFSFLFFLLASSFASSNCAAAVAAVALLQLIILIAEGAPSPFRSHPSLLRLQLGGKTGRELKKVAAGSGSNCRGREVKERERWFTRNHLKFQTKERENCSTSAPHPRSCGAFFGRAKSGIGGEG